MTRTADIARRRLGLSDRATVSRLTRFKRRLQRKRFGEQPLLEIWRVS